MRSPAMLKMSAAMKLPRSDKYKISHSGDKNSQAKLTWSQVNEIREFYDKTDVTKASLARKYNVTNRTIFLIVNNLSWKVNQQ